MTPSTLRRRRPTLGVLYGWQIDRGDMDLYLESLVSCLTAVAQRAEINLLTAVAVSKTDRIAYAESSLFEDHALPSGVAYLPKPFSSHELNAKIASVLPEQRVVADVGS